MKVKLFFAWFDMWIGGYWSESHHTLYLCVLGFVAALQFIRDDKIQAPFTRKEIISLNDYQKLGSYHPYTCGSNSDHILIATKWGWVCPECDYTQNWAHQFTADYSWKKDQEEFEQWKNAAIKDINKFITDRREKQT